ncbi:alanine--tRNA ligase [Methylolobus aquaticus]|nr:alanine--tRNA ligase [Methylolobus aquaticus]
MTSAELRSLFLRFFEERGHTIVASSSLVPGDDPTLLFTNAGMVQFKDVFLGREDRPYVRATSSQRCVRAGGKHNDLENVGYTARHHTFFEMLGNFSFGDYFKRDAIRYAWEFLTQTLALPAERLWVTVYIDDGEAESIWLNDVGVSPARFTRIAGKDNFWAMGDTGPCGPCTEIFYDHGPAVPGGPPGSEDAEGDRYVEIWNLVFMQYERAQDGTLTPLPKPSVDTGMGLERLAAVMQGVHNNYETDLFRGLVAAAARLAGTSDLTHSSLRVVADHIRSSAFLIADGVLPSNEGRGYVLRRIIRRAIRHGYKLGIRETFFSRLVGPLCDEMGAAYPELPRARDTVEKALEREERRFAETLEQGMRILEACIAELPGQVIPGETAFQLYDTYGFPVDLIADVAREHGLSVDMAGFEQAMAGQRQRARAASHFKAGHGPDLRVAQACQFTGYEELVSESRVVALLHEGKAVDSLPVGGRSVIVLERTPFYAESGGQCGDQGWIETATGRFEVDDTQRQGADVILHHGRVTEGVIGLDQPCRALVDATGRAMTAANHSATHLLHSALRRILGEHVTQKGSLVNAERLRFDFAHFEPVHADQLVAIEHLVNGQIRHNWAVDATVMPRDEALSAGAMALFGEKYGDEVRVLRMGDFSTELCGGTHVSRVGDIGFFKIVAETGVASGVRRIEAVTGEKAGAWVTASEQLLQTLAMRIKANREQLDERLQQVLERARILEKELERIKAKAASSAGSDLAGEAVDVEGVRVLAVEIPDADAKTLRDLIDQLKQKLGSAVIVLAAVKDGKVSLVAGVTQDHTARLKAGELIAQVAAQVGGKGGGRADLAQAGGADPSGLPNALAGVVPWVRSRLQ